MQCLRCRRRREERLCIICGSGFVERPGRKRVTCGRLRAAIARARASRDSQSRKVVLAYEWCGDKKFVSPCYQGRRFCSLYCSGRSISGENNRNWRGGVTSERDLFHASSDWKMACRDVWGRERGRCQRCGTKANRGHHVKPWAAFPDHRLERSNLVLLCVECHVFVHSRGNAGREFVFHDCRNGSRPHACAVGTGVGIGHQAV